MAIENEFEDDSLVAHPLTRSARSYSIDCTEIPPGCSGSAQRRFCACDRFGQIGKDDDEARQREGEIAVETHTCDHPLLRHDHLGHGGVAKYGGFDGQCFRLRAEYVCGGGGVGGVQCARGGGGRGAEVARGAGAAGGGLGVQGWEGGGGREGSGAGGGQVCTGTSCGRRVGPCGGWPLWGLAPVGVGPCGGRTRGHRLV